MDMTLGRDHGATKDNTEFDVDGHMHRGFRRRTVLVYDAHRSRRVC